jgi:hypothetical protein
VFLLLSLALFVYAVVVMRQPAPTDRARWTRAGITGGLLLAGLLVASAAAP